MKRFVRFIISTNFEARALPRANRLAETWRFLISFTTFGWFALNTFYQRPARGEGAGRGWLDSVHRLNGIKHLFDNDFTMLSQPWPRKFVARSFPIESRFNVRLADGKMVGEQWAHCVIFCIMPSRSRATPSLPPPSCALHCLLGQRLMQLYYRGPRSPLRSMEILSQWIAAKKKRKTFRFVPAFLFCLWDYNFSYLPGDK